MVPFGWSRDEDKSDIEKELDRIAEEGVKIVKAGHSHTPSDTKSTAEPEPSDAKPDRIHGSDASAPVCGLRVIAETHANEKGKKSILLGTKGKHARLVFHSRDELVEFINDLRKAVGGDVAALAEQHFDG